jgi:hypothetical protein
MHQVRLLDATGRCVHHQPANGAAQLVLETDALPAGVYTVVVQGTDGAVRTGRVVKQ